MYSILLNSNLCSNVYFQNEEMASLLSSFSANNDLMEEMEKLEAADGGVGMTDGKTRSSRVHRMADNTAACKSSSPTCHNKVEDAIQNATDSRGVTKRTRSQRGASNSKNEDSVTNLKSSKTIIDSPSQSPLDKKQRMQRRTGAGTKALQSDCNGQLVKSTESNAHVRPQAHASLQSGYAAPTINSQCHDISYSPLITTPDITPVLSRNSGNRQNKGLNISSKGVNSNIADTPRRPKSRKRLSPNSSKSPVVKIIKSDNQKGLVKVQNNRKSNPEELLENKRLNNNGTKQEPQMDQSASLKTGADNVRRKAGIGSSKVINSNLKQMAPVQKLHERKDGTKITKSAEECDLDKVSNLLKCKNIAEGSKKGVQGYSVLDQHQPEKILKGRKREVALEKEGETEGGRSYLISPCLDANSSTNKDLSVAEGEYDYLFSFRNFLFPCFFLFIFLLLFKSRL